MIKREGSKYKLYTSDGSRVLGTHENKKSAIKQEQAIQISKHKNKNKIKSAMIAAVIKLAAVKLGA